ncbi:hypothetical protein PUV54_10765 [Hyphococcus flavus]|uniref:Uncharacterized protein n=1 Tax=Hyphococcus flavus TaxID=1866326 RepID=A0AAE9ZAA1_9PROT|nr:hypothetical protein [Hyphococcus flavus]WDI30439.1 hypothetical protein PUV54_10765 [Hyphococcus flavus]
MAFAINKVQGVRPANPHSPNKKRSPLAGWLGKKPAPSSESELPVLDVAGGLNRALRNSQTRQEKSPSSGMQENPVREALSAIEAALYAIDRVRDILEQACEVTISAKEADDAGGRALLAESYDELRLSINEALEKVDPRASVLIGTGQRHIDVMLGGRAKYSVSPVRLDVGERGLDLPPPADAFATDHEIDEVLAHLDKALGRADRAAASFCRDAQYLIARMKAEAAANV